jgi:hypothetical protein
VQKRISDEISQYHKNAATNKRIAIERETKRKEKSTKRAQSVDESLTDEHEAPPNHKPLTNNQEPLTKENKRTTRFTPPTLQEVTEYCQERKNTVSPQKFIDYYQGNGWMRGKSKIKCWKSCVRTWEQNSDNNQTASPGPRPMLSDIMRDQRNGV